MSTIPLKEFLSPGCSSATGEMEMNFEFEVFSATGEPIDMLNKGDLLLNDDTARKENTPKSTTSNETHAEGGKCWSLRKLPIQA